MNYQHVSSRFVESALVGLTSHADLVINVECHSELSNLIDDAGVDAAIIVTNDGSVQEAWNKLPLAQTTLKRVEGKGKTAGQGKAYKWYVKGKKIGSIKWVPTLGDKKLVTCRVIGLTICDIVSFDGLSIQSAKYTNNGRVFRK